VSTCGDAIVEVIRSALDRLDRLPTGEADQIIGALVADLRTRRPMAVAPLSDWAPTETPPSGPPGGSAA
jgi:hypothetical protein